MVEMDNSEKVIQALSILQEEGREDLLQEGVLQQSWVGLKRPKSASSEGMVAAVIVARHQLARQRNSGKKVSVEKVRLHLIAVWLFKVRKAVAYLGIVLLAGEAARSSDAIPARRLGSV
ncbi:hypothetical protein NDU88_003192 [Pleurodeles waltl]|uniref:Uncharacterized protein n=1 Tax=Pleurodeles waltl TaxID=8319 RepID=A0AAV7RDL6_PLEWA|nr:hypothetical protein NDU88_003192 [Pleurodeles waltl]